MKYYKATIVAAALAAASMSFGTAANAGPLGAFQKNSAVEQSDLKRVDWRPYRHCHRRYGRRHCHSGRGYRRYGYGPGISLHFGFGRGHHRHHRHHHHRRYWR